MLLLVGGLPLFANVISTYPFEASKAGLLRIVGVLLLLVSLPRPSVWLLAPLFVVESYLISTATSVQPLMSAIGSTDRGDGPLTAIALLGVCLAATKVTDWRRIADVAICASALVCLVAVAQRLGYDPVLHAYAAYRGAEVEAPAIAHPWATLGSSEYVGSYLAVLIPITLWRTLRRGIVWEWTVALGGLAVLLQLATLWLTGNRGAIVALGITGLVVSWRLGMRAAAVVVALVAFAAVGGLYASRGATSTSERLLVAREVPAMVVQRPWLGYGPEMFDQAFPQDVDVGEGHPTAMVQHSHRIDGALNVELDALVTRGIVGLIATLAFWAVGLVGAWRWRGPVGMAMFATLLAAFVDGQIAPPTIAVAVFEWLLVGVVIGHLQFQQEWRR